MNNQNINPKSLKGKDVFNRTLELMNKITPLNESVLNASLEFIKRAPNGLVYTIIRENRKYFIKSTDKSEFKISDLDYSGGLQNKMMEAYSTYEEALKHLNMKFQQLNELYDIKDGYNLFEQDAVDAEESGEGEKKYKLKVNPEGGESSEEMSEPSAEMPSPEASSEEPTVSDVPAAPEGEEMPSAPEGEEGVPSPKGEEMPSAPEGEEMPEEAPAEGDEDMDDLDIDDDEEDPKKYVQKLTGRLGQKLRELPEVDPKLEKYVINSVISALHVDKMDKKDRMDVIRKFKKKKGMESMMKESYGMDEYYGMMSLDGPFNFEKIKSRGFDEDNIESHPKKHRPLSFKKYELDMDEELIGGQKKLDINKNGKLDAEDFKMLRSKKKRSSDEQWQAALADMAIPAIGSYIGKKLADNDEGAEITFHGSKDETTDSDVKLQNALRRIKKKRAMDHKKRMSDMDELFGHDKPGVAEPGIAKPVEEPKPRVPNPFEGDDDETLPMPGPKMRKKHQELTFESIIEKYRVKK